jgi:hypothetical protein
MGTDAHKQNHLFKCALADPTKKDVDFWAELSEKTENGSIQKGTPDQLAAAVNTTPSLFLVPSLVERFLTNKLTDRFLKEHADIFDQDLVLEKEVLDSEPSDNQNTGDGGPPGLPEDEEKS